MVAGIERQTLKMPTLSIVLASRLSTWPELDLRYLSAALESKLPGSPP